MGAEPSEADSREQRLDALLFDYLRAAEAGQAPDREEWLAQYPDLAGELAAFLAEQDRFDRAAAPLRAVGRAAGGRESADAVPERLGDFRIVRELGRGGMGVVYEAEQVSLGRRVALKVLPLAATLGGTQLQRFHNEARAAAGLHHTNIVPVYFVGCERGVHFYAMQFIHGRSLADVLAQLRRPADQTAAPPPADAPTTADVPPAGGGVNGTASTQPAALLSTAGGARGREYFRAVAELGVQAAEALDYGHRVGVVHRDIKPGNLLLDGAGRLWVTDFGLAQVRGGDGLTATGELVGTLRYMSPEQALAKRVVLDHRTDVYSLGATLYELLALRPPFGGSDRQELLRQIAFEEPVPPGKVNRAVPPELETIVLKAVEKAPPDRYATAQELADDLRRWLDDRPIRARRPSWLRVAGKWVRRHRPLVVATAVVLLVAAVLGGSNRLWWAQKRAVAEGEARAALQEASGLEEEERWSEALSAARRAEGILAGVGGDPGLQRQVREVIEDVEMARRLQEAKLSAAGSRNGDFDWAEADRSYAAAFGWYGLDVDGLSAEAVAAQIRARSIQRQLAAALDEWAYIRRQLKVDGSRQRLAVARAVDPDAWRNRLRAFLEGKDPTALEEALAPGQAEDWPAPTLVLLAKAAAGSALGERAVPLLTRAQQRHPDAFWMSFILGQILYEARPPRLDEAIRFRTAAVALRPQSPTAHNNLGIALHARGRLEEAIAEFREALRLENNYPLVHRNLGNALHARGRLEEAIAEYREATRLNKDSPEAHCGLGAVLFARGQLNEAAAEYRTAIRLNKDYALAHFSLGGVLSKLGRLEEAIAECRRAISINKDIPEAHNNLGAALGKSGRLDEAITEFHEAIRLRMDYAEAHSNLGRTFLEQGQFRQAAEELRLGHELGSGTPGSTYPPATWLRTAERLADLENRLPALLNGKEQPKDTGEQLALAQLCQLHKKKLFAASAHWYGEAFVADRALAGDIATGNRYNAACAAALAGCGQGQDANRLSDKDRAGLRKQARDWLRADLGAWGRLLEQGPAQNRPAIAQQLAHWLEDTDFNGVRGEPALAKLPAAERGDWQKLWQEVEALRQRAARPPDKAAVGRP